MTIHQGTSHEFGAPVVALHSSASNRAQWKELMEALADRHEVYAFDLPGYGKRSGQSANKSGMTGVAMSVLEDINRIGEPVHLIGHSYGGAVAMKIAMLRPDLVKSLTLYEPAVFHLLKNGSASDRTELDGLRPIETSLSQQGGAKGSNLGAKAFVEFWNNKGSWEQLSETIRVHIANAAPAVLADFENSLGENWTLEDMPTGNIPVQVMMGMESPTVAQRAATLVFDGIPNAELVMLPGLGHMAPIHAPEWVNPRIGQHIARVERSADNFSWPQRTAA